MSCPRHRAAAAVWQRPPPPQQQQFLLPVPSLGARWTFTDLEQGSPPQLPLSEQGRHCVIYPAVAHGNAKCKKRRLSSCINNDNKKGSTNQGPVAQIKNDDDDSDDNTPDMTLQRADNPSWVYVKLPTKNVISLNHHEENWGQVWFAMAHPITTNKEKDKEVVSSPRYVAIKQLNKAVVADYLLADGPENPYTELCRLQAFSNEACVVNCWEALQDQEYLYMVTPRAPGGTLYDLVFNPFVPLSAKRVHNIFVQLLHILALLERHYIHHRDLSPDNLLIFENDHIQVMDFALSMRIPRCCQQQQKQHANGQQRRTLLRSNVGTFGTHAYMAPELIHENAFDGVAADLWSVMVILYNLHTRHKLYDQPLATDWSFRYFILQQGLVSVPQNQALLQDDNVVDRRLRARAAAHLQWQDSLVELFRHSLVRDPHQRWTLAQVMECNYVQDIPT